MSSSEINRGSVKYGSRTIEYAIQEKEGLKSHYISVERSNGVVLRGRKVSRDRADRLILKKAKWILEKLRVVSARPEEELVTGSRIPYLGRNYYVQVIINKAIDGVKIEFNQSKFKISVKTADTPPSSIRVALSQFYKDRAIEKITPRVERWSKKTGLAYRTLRFSKMRKRWGSCTGTNNVIINTEAIKLPFSLIDYVIVHELCHTKVKDHSKRFWAEISKYSTDWKVLDERIRQIKL